MEYTINSRRYDRSIRKTWTCELIEQRGTLLLFRGVFDREVHHPDLGHIEIGTVSYEYYWLDRWYNVFRFHRPNGRFRNFYCNINMPPELGDGFLDYVDLDLDLLSDTDGNFRILDEDEYLENSKAFGYSARIMDSVDAAVIELKSLIANRQFPFDLPEQMP